MLEVPQGPQVLQVNSQEYLFLASSPHRPASPEQALVVIEVELTVANGTKPVRARLIRAIGRTERITVGNLSAQSRPRYGSEIALVVPDWRTV